jgi:hypothetical protein
VREETKRREGCEGEAKERKWSQSSHRLRDL